MEDHDETKGLGEGSLLQDRGGVRYIFHREHKHPLTLAETNGSEGRCCRCRDSSPGLTYNCSRCKFYLHKICTGNPDVIGSPLHPHPLTRDFCIGSTCISCRSTYSRRSNFYKCSKCDFSLDQKCAFALPAVSKHYKKGLSCQSCHSALALIEKKEDDEGLCCVICKGRCSGPTYLCAACKYCFHPSCSTGPREIQHPSHPFHCLTRTELIAFRCSSCLEDLYGTSYRCEECDFNLDFKCAFLLPREEFEGKEPIVSDIHLHPLALTDEANRMNGDCIVCYEPCSLSTYCCRACRFYVNVHKSCATTKIPEVLHHTLFPDHPLRRSSGKFTCNVCLKDRSGYYYELADSSSEVKLDVRCAYLDQPLITFDGHSHPLILLVDFTFPPGTRCNACGGIIFCVGTPPVFHCPTCNIKLHMLCGPLPCSIKQETHMDILELKDSLVEDLTGYDEFFCDSCEENRDPRECVYYCSRCNYCVEIKCIMHELKLALLGRSGDVELRTLGRWNHSGKLRSKGLLSEEMEWSSTDTKSACCLRGIFQSLTKDEEAELDNLFNSSEKLFEDLIGGCDRIQDAQPYSDEEFIQLVQKLDSVRLRDLEESREFHDTKFVSVGEYLVPQHLLQVYNDLYRKYGDLASETKLSINLKSLVFLRLCGAIKELCSTKVIDITESKLMEWCVRIKGVHRAGFKVQFATDALKIAVLAYYGLLFRRNLDQEIRSLEEEIPKKKEVLEELEGALKHHKEYFKFEEPSLVKDCTEEASLLMYKTAGEVVLE